MKVGGGLAGLAAAGLVVGGLWFFGRDQPVEIVERKVARSASSICPTCQGSKQGRCQLCNGEGRVPAGEQSCPKCNGTGKGKWQLKGAGTGNLLGGDPVCLQCRGSGRWGSWQTCALCSGTKIVDCPDCAGTGTRADSNLQTVRTVHAGHSLWERVLSWILIAPDDDCAPQVRPGGSVPLVESYVRLFERDGLSMSVVRWGAVSRGANGWEVRTLLRIRRGSGETEEGRLFVVRNREVTGAHPHTW